MTASLTVMMRLRQLTCKLAMVMHLANKSNSQHVTDGGNDTANVNGDGVGSG